MTDLPKDSLPDATLVFRRDPYRFISQRCDELGSDLFETRLMLEKVICMRGEEAARLFYDGAKFRRKGAVPERISKVLFGEGGVQGLDGAAHRHRKALFLELMTEPRLDALEEMTRKAIEDRIPRWREDEDVTLHHAFLEVAAAVAMDWAGAPEDTDSATHAVDLARMFESAASAGPAYWLAEQSRARIDDWARGLIEAVRAGELTPPEGTPLAVIPRWTDEAGEPLPADVAAVEFVNIVRPITAASVWMIFLVHAMHENGQRPGDRAEAHRLQLEVRRLYPFFPVLGARVIEDFDWGGITFPADRLVLLDLYGTNRDERLWQDADTFRPDRFRAAEPGPFQMMPQGGGDPAVTHRCPGEWICERMMIATAEIFGRLDYEVPEQDLTLRHHHMPAMPRSGMVIALK